MNYANWLAFFSYTTVTAITPGPNNILCLNTAGNYGLKKSFRLLSGIWLGFLSVQLLCGIFSSALAALIPDIMPYMKYLGAAYILWLAYHIATSKPLDEAGNGGTTSFWKGFFLQFANVKTILWSITAFTSYVLPYYNSYVHIILFAFLLTLIGACSNFIWATAGSVFSKVLRKYWRVANILMALVLVYSAVHLILG